MVMSDQWYFAWGEREFGPYTADELKALAASGRLQPADEVWTKGMAGRVSATRVKNLFQVPEARHHDTEFNTAPAPASIAAAEQATEPEPAEEAEQPQEEATIASAPPPPQAHVRPPAAPHKKKARATAGQGAVIVSQDGERVQYRKKCMKCGFEEASRHSMEIRNGTARSPFFCPKCRKNQTVEITGMVH